MTRRAGFVVVVAAALASWGCGYRALHAEGAQAKLHVALVRTHVANTAAADEVVQGVRDALARDGALAAGEGYPRVEVEVLRTDELPEGIAGGATPSARSSSVAIIARGWLVREPGADLERDTGDMRAVDAVAPRADARQDLLQHQDAVRSIARRLGRTIGARILGHPTVGEETIGAQ